MSDLATFVAAAIRDHTLVELQKEVKALQEENSKLKGKLAKQSTEIKVTGPGGSPVYAFGDLKAADLKHRCYSIDLARTWESTVPDCPQTDFEKCELHIGNIAVYKLGESEIPRTWLSERSFVSVYFHRGNSVHLMCSHWDEADGEAFPLVSFKYITFTRNPFLKEDTGGGEVEEEEAGSAD